MTLLVFKEKQRFRQLWLWVFLLASVGLFLFGLISNLSGARLDIWGTSIGLATLVLVVVLFMSLKLETRIDPYSIEFRYPPLINRWKKIDREMIQSVQVGKYSPWEYGGWGIRYGGNGWAYNVRGNMGIIIKKKNGRRLLIGTQEPLKAKEAVENLMNSGDGIA